MSDPFPPPDLGDLRSLARVAADAIDPEHLELEEGVCLTCLGNGVITIVVGGPDSFGNFDADEIVCPECHGTGTEAADPETHDLTDGGARF